MTFAKKDENGYITNAIDLTADDVAHQKVLCPLCSQRFEMWPEGWDAHASSITRCNLSAATKEERKSEYKATLRHLFR